MLRAGSIRQAGEHLKHAIKASSEHPPFGLVHVPGVVPGLIARVAFDNRFAFSLFLADSWFPSSLSCLCYTRPRIRYYALT